MSLLTNDRESFVVGKHHPGSQDDDEELLRKTGGCANLCTDLQNSHQVTSSSISDEKL